MKRLTSKISLIIAMLTVIACCCALSGCGDPVYYESKSLEDAYDAGWLTEEHMMSIAYHYNNFYKEEPEEPTFDLIPKEELSKKVIKNIKLTFLRDRNYTELTVKDVTEFYYYGIYDGYVVALVYDSVYGYDFVFHDEKTIGGAVFYSYRSIRVYNTNV